MAKSKVPCVYILASSRNGTIYVGVTSDLPDRMEQHRQGLTTGRLTPQDGSNAQGRLRWTPAFAGVTEHRGRLKVC